MLIEDCFKLFNLRPEAALNDVKKTYRMLAKKNHPDRFVNAEQKKKQEYIMVKINEAYNQIVENFKNRKNDLNYEAKKDNFDNSGKESDYSLYKKGLDYYNKCYEGISKMAKHNLKDREDTLNEAKSCFKKILKEYPDSDWAFDSEEKLRKIEKMIDGVEKEKKYDKDAQWTPRGTPKKDSGFYTKKFKDMFH
jgi:curved DNA-binding protein CbpA